VRERVVEGRVLGHGIATGKQRSDDDPAVLDGLADPEGERRARNTIACAEVCSDTVKLLSSRGVTTAIG
jgi:hypothetical protein